MAKKRIHAIISDTDLIVINQAHGGPTASIRIIMRDLEDNWEYGLYCDPMRLPELLDALHVEGEDHGLNGMVGLVLDAIVDESYDTVAWAGRGEGDGFHVGK